MAWTNVLDVKDSTAKGGVRRDILSKWDGRLDADDMLRSAARAHADVESHILRNEQCFPGATFIYCECGACFHNTERR